jgi:hypothetical protein
VACPDAKRQPFIDSHLEIEPPFPALEVSHDPTIASRMGFESRIVSAYTHAYTTSYANP